ncbi:MAG: nucleotidyltransferase domain-containing protein [Nitrospirota bacterium]|nr:nucleotidyltransferase domain-containing protein [Nitrospirota bacterium]
MQSFVVEESSNSVRVFWLKQEELIREINRVAGEVGEKNKNVSKIVLFGSLAEKRAIPGSDADILILLKKDDKPFAERIVEWLEKFQLDFPVEVFPYIKKEEDNPIVLEAIKKGITLFERDGTTAGLSCE